MRACKQERRILLKYPKTRSPKLTEQTIRSETVPSHNTYLLFPCFPLPKDVQRSFMESEAISAMEYISPIKSYNYQEQVIAQTLRTDFN